MSKAKKKIIIIDGNALIHRSFHALPPTIATKSGEMVNAVYGFASVLIKALKEFKPVYAVLTLDKKGPTFRHREYKEYKAHREKAPDDLYKQISRVKEIAIAFNIPIFEMSGFEADDLIGTISNEINSDIEKIIVTGDLDALQLVDASTKVYTMSRGFSDSVLYDITAVKNRFGLAPNQMIDYKSLRGDPSDNIPGVRGIGEKTAVNLLNNFKTLDGVYKYIESKGKKDKIKLRTLELLKEYKKDAYLSYHLATIKRDVKIDFKLDNAVFGDFAKEKVVKLFSELEFKSLLPRIKDFENVGEEADDKFERNKKLFKYQLISKEQEFKDFFNELKKKKTFTFDTETSSFDPLTSDLLGISFSWKKGEAYYVKIRNEKLKIKSEENNLFNYNKKDRGEKKHPWLEKLKPIFEDKEIKKNAHNAKFDIRVLQSQGINFDGIDFDTMIASYLLNPGTRQHNLDALTFSELGFEKISKEDLLGKGKDKITFSEIDTNKLSLYSCEDADFTCRLKNILAEKLEKQKINKLFTDIEMPLIMVLSEIENNGVKINKRFLANMSEKMALQIKKLEKNIYKEAGVEFNIKSTQQLREVLFEKLEIPFEGIGKIKTGLSTSADELAKLKGMHSIIPLIQKYRELTKLTSTYIDALPTLINKKTNRIHTSFNQAVTATGRLSSTEPNLQNIPTRTEPGREIRKSFIAEKGYELVGLDYSQIELRLAAHMSEDKKMIKAFNNGEDIHTATAAEILKIDLEKVDKKMRSEAKAINFGVLYGQGPHGLSQSADIPYCDAREFIKEYFLAYINVRKFIDSTIEKARETGYVETMFGRRRYLPEINSSVIMVRKGAERMAINAPIQGTSADMIKIAMIEINKMINKKFKKDEVRMISQVHDELLFEIKRSRTKDAVKDIKQIMENVIKLKVPVIVDVSVGENWGEMKNLEL